MKCNTHSRRKYEPIARAVKNKDSLAKAAMLFYRRIYRFETKAKDAGFSPEQVYEYRIENTKPLFDDFKLWLEEHNPTLLPKSPLGKAFYYTLKHWDGLTAFFKDGRLEIDNNLTEQQIKAIVMARKNFLFASSINGANAMCNQFSLIRTALHHKLEPYKYMTKVLEELPYCLSVDDFEALLPWNINLPKVGILKAA